jgi:hypothetical protein
MIVCTDFRRESHVVKLFIDSLYEAGRKKTDRRWQALRISTGGHVLFGTDCALYQISRPHCPSTSDTSQ